MPENIRNYSSSPTAPWYSWTSSPALPPHTLSQGLERMPLRCCCGTNSSFHIQVRTCSICLGVSNCTHIVKEASMPYFCGLFIQELLRIRNLHKGIKCVWYFRGVLGDGWTENLPILPEAYNETRRHFGFSHISWENNEARQRERMESCLWEHLLGRHIKALTCSILSAFLSSVWVFTVPHNNGTHHLGFKESEAEKLRNYVWAKSLFLLEKSIRD